MDTLFKCTKGFANYEECMAWYYSFEVIGTLFGLEIYYKWWGLFINNFRMCVKCVVKGEGIVGTKMKGYKKHWQREIMIIRRTEIM